MGGGSEPNLGIDEITVRLSKLAHVYARERFLEVERLAGPLPILHAVEHGFGVACTRQGGPRVNNGHNIVNGISTLSVGIGCARADAVGTVERDGLLQGKLQGTLL